MKTNVVKLVAGFAWAGVAVATATPAGAVAFTSQTGDYASCSANYEWYGAPACFDGSTHIYTLEYQQSIKFVSTACSAGGCNSDTGVVYTTNIYSTGRKTTSYHGWCDYNLYELGSCAC